MQHGGCRPSPAAPDSSLLRSRLRISGLAALISTFRLAVGVQGSAASPSPGFGGVASGWQPGRGSAGTEGEAAACFRGVPGGAGRFSCATGSGARSGAEPRGCRPARALPALPPPPPAAYLVLVLGAVPVLGRLHPAGGAALCLRGHGREAAAPPPPRHPAAPPASGPGPRPTARPRPAHWPPVLAGGAWREPL